MENACRLGQLDQLKLHKHVSTLRFLASSVSHSMEKLTLFQLSIQRYCSPRAVKLNQL